MPETQLDAIRRMLREGEERLKKAAAENPPDTVPDPDKPAAEDPAPAAPTREQRSPAKAASPEPHASIQELQFLQRKLKTVLEGSRDAILSVDGNREWTPANRRLREWLGYNESELSEIDFENLFPSDVATMLLDSFPQWLEGASPLRRVPGVLRGKRSAQIPVLISSHSMVDELAEPIAFLTFEDRRQQRDMKLQLDLERAFIDTILNEGTIPTLVMRKDGSIAEAGRSAREWLGIGSKAISDMRLRDLVHPAGLEEFDAAFERALQALPPVECLCTFQRNSESVFRGRIFLTGIPDVHGKVERVIAFLDHIVAEPSSAWTAYGRMTPGVLSELSFFMADLIRVVLEQIRTKEKPDVKRLVNGINDVRSIIFRWMDSAALIPEFQAPCAFGDVIRQAVDLRKAEFSRWGITPQIEITPAVTETRSWPPEIFQALLHVIQWCIENLREEPANRRLVIWVQKAGDQLEASFLCRSAGASGTAVPADPGNVSEETLHFTNLEFLAAKRLLDSLSSTLILENIGATHRAIRVSMNTSRFASDRTPADREILKRL